MLAAMAVFSVFVLGWGSRAVRDLVGEAIASTRRLVPGPDPTRVDARRARRRRVHGSAAGT